MTNGQILGDQVGINQRLNFSTPQKDRGSEIKLTSTA